MLGLNRKTAGLKLRALHIKFGHVNSTQLVLNFVKVRLMSFVKIVSTICKICVNGKKNHNASNIRSNDRLYLVAADVCALYPSIERETVKMVLELALKEHSKFNLSGQRILVSLAMHCLNSIIIQYTNKFYLQKQGIITGENNSVSFANISMHFIMLKISHILNQA